MSVTCTSHNLSQLEEITTELKKDSFMLDAFMNHELSVTEDQMPDDFNTWYSLLYDHVCYARQHISDLLTWEKAIRKEHDFNSDSND